MENFTPALKKTLLLAFLVCIFISSNAASYYFSSSTGNDTYSSAQAQNAATPWKSIDKLNAVFKSLLPGDTIFFKRGDVFTGSIRVRKSGTSSAPIVLTAYGSGDKPVISGLATLSSWTSLGGGIWQTTSALNAGFVNEVLINDVQQQIGRYPNVDKGYLYYQQVSGNSSITDNALSSTPNWTGGEIVIRKKHSVLDRGLITSHSGSTINYTSETADVPYAGFGYFIQNHPKTLDQFGEWYYSTKDKKISVYFGSSSPSSYDIKGSIMDTLVFVNSQSNIVFDNLCLKGSNQKTFQIEVAQNIRINKCDILQSGNIAVYSYNANNITIENSTISNTNNVAFLFFVSSGVAIRNNDIKKTGIVDGMGRTSLSYHAIHLSGNNNVIEYNRIDSTGYIPIDFSGNSLTIRNNYITNYGFVKDDGGAIYTWNNSQNPPVYTNRIITGNIILNGFNAPQGTDSSFSLRSDGIYADDNSSNIAITYNTVSNTGAGIHLHNTHEVTVSNNTVYNNASQIVISQDRTDNFAASMNLINRSNIFYSKLDNQSVAVYKTLDDNFKRLGSFDSNYYSKPVSRDVFLNVKYTQNSINKDTRFNLDGWYSNFGMDANSKTTATTIPAYTILNLVGKNKFVNGKFDSNIKGAQSWSAAKNFTSAWSNSAGLDSGSLMNSFSSISGTSKGIIYFGIDTVVANKNYIVKFTMIGGTKGKSIEFSLQQKMAPNRFLSFSKFCSMYDKRTETEVLIQPTVSENNASLLFNVEEQSKAFSFDNIQVYEANIAPVNVDDYLLFYYNPSTSAQTYTFNGTYVDAKNTNYSGSITLQPFSSAVLIKKSFSTTPAPNKAPVANAGADQTITLPANSVTLSGSGIDSDGSIASYAWSTVSGPVGGLITSPSSAKTTVSNLTQGTYLFELTVKDTSGAIGKDTVQVTVNSVVTPPGSTNVTKYIKVNIYGGSDPYNNSEWNNWNVGTTENTNISSGTLKYSDGTASNINAVLSHSQSVGDNGATYGSSMAPAEVLRYTSYSSKARTVTISGLSISKQYNIELYASRYSSGNTTIFSLNNNNQTINVYQNYATKAAYTNITPDAQGTITISLNPGTNYSHLNGFTITELGSGSTSATVAQRSAAEESLSVATNNKVAVTSGIFPNPVQSQLQLKIKNEYKGQLKVQIVSAAGSVLKEFRYVKDQSQYLQTLPVNDLASGTYLLTIQIGNWKETKKLVKL